MIELSTEIGKINEWTIKKWNFDNSFILGKGEFIHRGLTGNNITFTAEVIQDLIQLLKLAEKTL